METLHQAILESAFPEEEIKDFWRLMFQAEFEPGGPGFPLQVALKAQESDCPQGWSVGYQHPKLRGGEGVKCSGLQRAVRTDISAIWVTPWIGSLKPRWRGISPASTGLTPYVRDLRKPSLLTSLKHHTPCQSYISEWGRDILPSVRECR